MRWHKLRAWKVMNMLNEAYRVVLYSRFANCTYVPIHYHFITEHNFITNVNILFHKLLGTKLKVNDVCPQIYFVNCFSICLILYHYCSFFLFLFANLVFFSIYSWLFIYKIFSLQAFCLSSQFLSALTFHYFIPVDCIKFLLLVNEGSE